MFITKQNQCSNCIQRLVVESVQSVAMAVGGVGEGVVSSAVDRGVVDQGGGGREDGGVARDDGGVSLGVTLLSVSLGGLNGGQVSGLGLSNLGGVDNGSGCDAIEDRGDQGLGVEGGCNTVVDRGNGQTGVLNTESSGVSNIVDLLEDTLSIDIRVSTGHTTVGVSNLLLGRVDVGITVVQVSELILGVELASLGIRSIGIGVGNSSGHRGSIGDGGGSSHRGGIGDRGGSSNSGDRGGLNLDSLGSDGGHRGGSIGVSIEGTSIRISKSSGIRVVG